MVNDRYMCMYHTWMLWDMCPIKITIAMLVESSGFFFVGHRWFFKLETNMEGKL